MIGAKTLEISASAASTSSGWAEVFRRRGMPVLMGHERTEGAVCLCSISLFDVEDG